MFVKDSAGLGEVDYIETYSVIICGLRCLGQSSFCLMQTSNVSTSIPV